MEEILAKKSQKDCRTPKIVLKDQEKRGIEFQKMMQELDKKLGPGKLTKEMKRVDFWEIVRNNPNKYLAHMEIDTDLDEPFENVFYTFMKFLDTESLPLMETTKLMDLSKPRRRLTETSINNQQILSKEIAPSGMFYINNTFYVDKRDPKYKDYSEVVKKWGSSKGLTLGETFKMESTLMSDLTVMLNYPYLYQHLGNCEHLVMVKKIRFVHATDSKPSSDYPLLYMIGITRDVICVMCKKQPMQCTVTGSKRSMKDPLYCCIKCYEQFFSVNQKPVEKNAVCYPFLNRSDLINLHF